MASRSLEILKAMGVRGGVVSRTVEDGGVARMKILVKRQELKQVLEQVTANRDDNKSNLIKKNNLRKLSRSLGSRSFEPQLVDMKKIKIVESDQVIKCSRSYWTPKLQSIPEEL